MKIRKTVITVTIMHPDDEPLDHKSLGEIGYQIDEGDWLGQIGTLSGETVPPNRIVAEAETLGNDGSFPECMGWLLDDAGKPVEQVNGAQTGDDIDIDPNAYGDKNALLQPHGDPLAEDGEGAAMRRNRSLKPPDDGRHETAITHTNGASLLFSAYPEQVSYIRVVDAQDSEIAYWTVDEVSEDPADVLGAIFGAVLGGTAVTVAAPDRRRR